MSRVYETAIKIGAAISKSFKSDTHGAAAALTKLTAATKQLKTAEKAAGAYKKLSGELTRAKGRYDTASAALRKLQEAENAAGGATKESTKWRKAGEREVAAAARQLDRATKAAQKNAAALTKLGVDTSRMATEQDRLTRALAATERQEKSLGRYEHARERLFGKRKEHEPLVGKAKEQLKGIGETVLHLGEVGIGAAAAVFEVVKRTGEAGDEAAKMAKRVGIGVTSLQEFRYAGQRMGATAEDVDSAVGKMLINIGKWKAEASGKKGGGGGLAIPGVQTFAGSKTTSSGGGSVLDPFKMLGISAKKLSELKPEQQIDQIADAMVKLKTDADRAAVAQAIFGREGGLKLVPLMKGGAAGIAQLRREARELGYVISEEGAKQAEEFKDSMLDAQMAATGLTNTLGVALLPVVTDTFKRFTGWVKTNRVEIKQWIGGAATWIEKKGIPGLFRLGREAESLGAKVLYVVHVGEKLTGGLGNLAIVVAGLRMAPLALTLGKIAVNGTKAAIAVYKYAAAAKAAKAAGGEDAAGGLSAAGTALGLAAKASMVAGAATIGYAIGTEIDNYFHLSDRLSQLGVAKGEDKSGKQNIGFFEQFGLTGVRKAQANAQIARNQQQIEQVKKLQSVGYSYEQASALVYRGATAAQIGAPARVPRAAGGGGASIGPIHIHPGTSRHDVGTGMDHAKHKVLEEFDRREAHRRRVAY